MHLCAGDPKEDFTAAAGYLHGDKLGDHSGKLRCFRWLLDRIPHALNGATFFTRSCYCPGVMPRARIAHHADRLEGTRLSLIGRLADWNDQARWREFFDTYWRLIYSVARRAGLSDAEAHDVVQETVIAVARNVARYDAAAGSFKGWLLQMTRWRIADQFRKRLPEAPRDPDEPDSARDTATLDRFPSPDGVSLEAAWDEEWREGLLEAALERVKRQVQPGHFQVFDCALRKQWPAGKIAAELGVNVAHVYLIKHRLARMLKKELRAVERG